MTKARIDRRAVLTASLGAAAAPVAAEAAKPAPRRAIKGRDFSAEKALVRSMMDDLAGAKPEEMAGVLERYVSPDWMWRGMHPFNVLTGPKAVADAFYAPLGTSLRPLQRRPDIFMAGLNHIDNFQSVWVVQMGHFMGLFDKPWLGIRPTGKIAMMRYCQFDKVVNGKIVETCMHFDIPQVMIQAGQNPFPPQTGAHLIQPGPMTHEGLMWDHQDPKKGEETMAAINRMLNSMRVARHLSNQERLALDWRPDMIWWGPCGIGATYTIDRYTLQHGRPFFDALYAERTFNGHICKTTEGHFGAFFGWANLTLRNAGGFMGMTAGPGLADMRVVDIYREQGGKLAENWVFIDMLHYLAMQGLDVLKRNEWLDYIDSKH